MRRVLFLQETMNFAFRRCLQTALLPKIIKFQCRHYPRWSHRSPLNVIPADQYDEIEDRAVKKKKPLEEELKFKWRYKTEKALEESSSVEEELERSPKKKQKRTHKTVPPPTTDMFETVIDAQGNFVYTKMSNNDPKVGLLLTTVKSKKEKTKRDLVLLEGKRLIKDALDSGCTLKYLIFTRKGELDYLKPSLPKIGAQLYKMPYKEMKMWSDLTTTPGVMGIFRTPEVNKFEAKNPIPMTIICDNVREPGNLGSILRVAAGAGCKRVILTKGCVALWDSKVTRSAAGSHFHIQIQEKADLKEVSKTLPDNVRCFIADNNVVTGVDESTTNSEAAEIIQNIPLVPYFSITCSKDDEIVLIIGGETEGISFESYKFASERNGVRLNIPLANRVESLNAGTALGIISFEIRKQLHTTNNDQTNKIAETDVSLGLRFI